MKSHDKKYDASRMAYSIKKSFFKFRKLNDLPKVFSGYFHILI